MKSYKRIGSSATTIQVLKFLAKQRGPVAGKAIATGLGLPYGTVMSHLATLEDEGLLEVTGETFDLSMGMSLFWAHRKAGDETKRARIEREMDLLGMNYQEV